MGGEGALCPHADGSDQVEREFCGYIFPTAIHSLRDLMSTYYMLDCEFSDKGYKSSEAQSLRRDSEKKQPTINIYVCNTHRSTKRKLTKGQWERGAAGQVSVKR